MHSGMIQSYNLKIW